MTRNSLDLTYLDQHLDFQNGHEELPNNELLKVIIARD